MTALTSFLTILSLIGVLLNTHEDRRCFYIWIVTNSCWAAVDFYKGIYAQGTMFILYLALSVWGLYKWRHKAVRTSDAIQ
jgi:nicotinamide riboside transporter PnuC